MSPNAPLPSTRERILAYLRENRSATVGGLSRAWNLTRADIRYHLTGLLEEGLVEIIPRDPLLPAPRGRPVQQYRLALHSTPDNFPALCAGLLELALGQTSSAEEQENMLRALSRQLTESFVSPPGQAQRFTQLILFLNQHAYNARWEAHASGPRILFRNCPYASIVARHPELCTLDRLILEQILSQPITQTSKVNMFTGKPPACVFSAGIKK